MSTELQLSVAFVAVVVGLVLTLVPALAAIRRYPDRHDPERSARRYVVPAIIGVVIVLAALAVLIIGSLGTIVAAVVETVT